MEKTQKTTVNLLPDQIRMLKEIEDRWGLTQTSVIRWGIALVHRFVFTERKFTES